MSVQVLLKFFCQACLVDKPPSDQSPDPRYCLGCYEFLLKEAELLSGGKRPQWAPKPQGVVKAGGDFGTPQVPICGKVEYGKNRASQNYTRYILPAGRPSIDLPVEKIRGYVSQGLGVRAIVRRLEKEGIKASRSTIHRAIIKKLQGELPIG